MTNELYFSCDIEADGPIPGPYSMLNFGAAAYLSDGTLVGTHNTNLLQLPPPATTDPKTMEWWNRQPEAWAAVRKDPLPPEEAIPEFIEWVEEVSTRYKKRPVFVAYPAGYDFMFLYWYMMYFAGYSPFSHSALDIKTLAFAALKNGYRRSTKKYMPKRWFNRKLKHTHVGVDDAIKQGALFCSILKELEIK